MRSHRLLAGGVALALMLLAQSALGATVSIPSGSTLLVYRAAAGEINDVSVVEAPDNVFVITDLNAVITPLTTECTSISANAVRCEVDPVIQLRVFTRDGADRVDLVSGGVWVYGGTGPDKLSGTRSDALPGPVPWFDEQTLLGERGEDRLVGRRGAQTLGGGGGADVLEGGLDNDSLFGGYGRDVLRGGTGNDWVSGEGKSDILAGGPATTFSVAAAILT
jgi:Ca2+-binding RTX toxin-like protein